MDRETFLKQTAKLAGDYLQREETLHPFQYRTPQQLQQHLDLEISEQGLSDEEFFSRLQAIMETTPEVGSRRFFNQLFGGKCFPALSAEMLSAVLNSSMYTFKAAGPHILIERIVIERMIEKVGYSGAADGTFTPGGSLANLVGMLLARNQADPASRERGVGRRMTAYASDISHYSLVKACGFMGVGRESLRKVDSDDLGRLDPEALRQALKRDLKRGFLPFCVVATAGTTVLGSYDPLPEIADVCREYGLWMHVDAALGGSALLSSSYRHLLEGSQLSHSFAWNLHKMGGVPLSCSVLLVNRGGLLERCFNENADYLFQSEHDFNPGTKSLQCGRRNDAFKAWALWSYYGDSGMDQRITHLFQLAGYARRKVLDHPRLELVKDIESVNVCFRVKEVDAVELCDRLDRQGVLKVGYGDVEGENVVRLPCVNSDLDEKDIDRFFDWLLEVAESLSVGAPV
ncbi:MAG TPA: pyridoxal-dependent decarboxylase [Acidobacteriota bacterium]|nr:pyridoxal-dependent decarboxylase [Acidobacteriota bacterium]